MNSTLESVVPLAMFFSEKNNVGVFWTDQVRKIYDKKYLTQRHGQKQRTLTEIQILRFDTQISTWKDFLVWGILIQINYENQLKMLGKSSNNQNGHLRWFFHQASDPPLMDIISRPFSTPLFFFCNWILHIWNRFYTSKISLLSPLIIGSKLTFISSSGHWLPTIEPCSKSSQLLYIHNIKPKLSAKHVFTVREWF